MYRENENLISSCQSIAIYKKMTLLNYKRNRTKYVLSTLCHTYSTVYNILVGTYETNLTNMNADLLSNANMQTMYLMNNKRAKNVNMKSYYLIT